MPLAPIASLDRLDDDDCRALRARFAAAGYDDALLGEAERIAPRQLDAVRLPLVHWWLERRRGPGAILARLFAYDAAVPTVETREALGTLADRLVDAGALVPGDGDTRVAAYRLMPVDGVWIWSDRLTDGEDAVMGPGATTLALMRLMTVDAGGTRAPRVLDVGCGAGTLGLWAARHGADATGTDLNRRAAALARFNARFNEVAAAFHAGDLAAPVAGRAFDLVVAQPPYVMQPGDGPKRTWLHGGAGGEDVTLRLLAELPALLAPGGLALLLVDAPSAGGEPPHARYRAALADSALDLVVLSAPGGTADQHATAFAALEDGALSAAYAQAVARYRSHFEAHGVKEFRRCAIVMRRAADGVEPRGLTATIPARALPADAVALERLLRGLDAAGAPDAALLASRVQPASGARWSTERASLDETAPATHRVSFGGGSFAEDRELSDAALAMLESLAEPGDVEEAVARYARRCDASPDEVLAAALTFVRQALATGLAEVAVAGAVETESTIER